MISIERGSPLPLCHQLKQVLLERIARGEFRPGVPLPGWRMLSARELEAPLEDFCGIYRGDRFSYRLSGPESQCRKRRGLCDHSRRIDVNTLTRTFGSLAGSCAVALLVAAPASALTIASGQSSVVPQFGAAESLSGTLDVAIGSLPLTQTTTFNVIGLSASASGGTTFALDPASLSPGLGVVNVVGAFLIPTLLLELDPGGGSFPIAIANVTGTALFDASGTVLQQLTTSFQVDSAGPAGILTITLVAVPEPANLVLAGVAGAGLVALALRGRTVQKEIAR